jgi:hypothetical protein
MLTDPFLFLLFAYYLTTTSDHHEHSHSHNKKEEEKEKPASKKQALESEKTTAADPMALNWNVDKMEE